MSEKDRTVEVLVGVGSVTLISLLIAFGWKKRSPGGSGMGGAFSARRLISPASRRRRRVVVKRGDWAGMRQAVSAMSAAVTAHLTGFERATGNRLEDLPDHSIRRYSSKLFSYLVERIPVIVPEDMKDEMRKEFQGEVQGVLRKAQLKAKKDQIDEERDKNKRRRKDKGLYGIRGKSCKVCSRKIKTPALDYWKRNNK